MIRRFMAQLVLAGAALASVWSCPVALAQNTEPTSLGIAGDWEAFTYESEDGAVCYVFAKPMQQVATRKVNRDPTHFMVTNWPARKLRGQPSSVIGYPFREGTVVKLLIDDHSFDLYPVDDMAWADKAATEKSIIMAMKAGRTMTLTGTSARGTQTTDVYSLEGISAALEKIDGACN